MQKNKGDEISTLHNLSSIYLKHTDERYSELEMEAKFGTKGMKHLTKMDYDNVAKRLKSCDWNAVQTTGEYLLRIHPEVLDVHTGKFKRGDKFRVEVAGLHNIQEYCKTNSIQQVNRRTASSVSIGRKNGYKMKDTDTYAASADFDSFNFRVSLNVEETISKTGKIGTEVFENWNRSRKSFRYLNRTSFIHPDHPFRVDLSIVKSSSKHERGWMIQTYNIDESNVFNNPDTYEIEVEVLPKAKTIYKTPEQLSAGLQRVVTIVLTGLQGTNYPVSYDEQRNILHTYHRLLFKDEVKKGQYTDKKYFQSSDFIGPGLVTLELINVGPVNENVIAPNITEEFSYCVTEKADGLRTLLYVTDIGRIYLINMNMQVMFTGAKTAERNCFNTILDGELVIHDKNGRFINSFVAFDVYFVGETDVRHRPFMKVPNKDEAYFKEGTRLSLLKEVIRVLRPTGISEKKASPISITSKQFYPSFEVGSTSASIFEASQQLLRRIADGEFAYEIDGLIYTPTMLGVGSSKIMEAGPKRKITWSHIFKWKPSIATNTFPKSYNTVDFLVVTKKGTDGKDIVSTLFEAGASQLQQYKTLSLLVGFDITKHGFINPCQDVLEDRFSAGLPSDEEGYKPRQFYPTNPYDPLAGICNVMLNTDPNGTMQMYTEEGDVFYDQMVVEFRYDMTKSGTWKWVPMRVRYDKTADFRSGNGVGANDYNTANSNWHSMYNPVTEEMLSTGQNIPSVEVSDDVYYNSVTNDKQTQRMRDFHNLYVKKALINGVSKNGQTLIDFACGKAGDLPKWMSARLSFVLGIDVAADNLEHRVNGACARYLNFKMTTKHMPDAIFLNGNSALNIRSGTNMYNDKANQIVRSLFGHSAMNEQLGKMVARHHGKLANGFDISSCQFAIHYMFENKQTFYQFMRNVAECTKLNGYFIATCYDGHTIFNMLRRKERSDIYVGERKIWSVIKMYNQDTYNADDSCLGYQIDVYQDSINQTLTEYLVNFDFLVAAMDKYGFSLVQREEAKHMGLPDGSAMFSTLFQSMTSEVQRFPNKRVDYKQALEMTDYEKDISFLNRYFVFKKTSNRNAETLTAALLQGDDVGHNSNSGVLKRRTEEKVANLEDNEKKVAKKAETNANIDANVETKAEEGKLLAEVKKKKLTRKKRSTAVVEKEEQV